MERVLGVGGVFFKARDPQALAEFRWVMDPEGNRIELWEPKTPF